MTREEAIKWLKLLSTMEISWDSFAMQDSQKEIRERCEQSEREAIDMAISALHFEADCRNCMWREKYEEQTEPSDLISRTDALEQMAQAECGLHYEDCEADNCSCSYISRILDLPSVSAERVVRCKDCKYWQDNNGGYPHEECRWGKEETPDEDDFCSYGVAKMKGGTD